MTRWLIKWTRQDGLRILRGSARCYLTLPSGLSEVERCDRAVEWLANQTGVPERHILLCGMSRA